MTPEHVEINKIGINQAGETIVQHGKYRLDPLSIRLGRIGVRESRSGEEIFYLSYADNIEFGF